MTSSNPPAAASSPAFTWTAVVVWEFSEGFAETEEVDVIAPSLSAARVLVLAKLEAPGWRLDGIARALDMPEGLVR